MHKYKRNIHELVIVLVVIISVKSMYISVKLRERFMVFNLMSFKVYQRSISNPYCIVLLKYDLTHKADKTYGWKYFTRVLQIFALGVLHPASSLRIPSKRLAPTTKRSLHIRGFKPRPRRVPKISTQICYCMLYSVEI